jgi:hypothetical protein
MVNHQLAEVLSLEYHRAVARHLREKKDLLRAAQERVRNWLASGCVYKYYAESWYRVLDRPLPEILVLLTDDSEKARALRQVSPFAGVLSPRERWSIWRRLRSEQSHDSRSGSDIGK